MSEYMFPALKEAQGKLDLARKQMAEVFSQATPDMDMSKVKCIEGDDAAKLAYIRKANDEEIPALKKRVEELRGVASAAEEAKKYGEQHPQTGGADESDEGKPKFKSFGGSIMQSEAVKGYRMGSGVGPNAFVDIDLKATFGTPNFGAGAGWDPFDPRTGHLQLTATRPSSLVFPWFAKTTTGFSTVKYMEETTFTNNAVEVQEGAAYTESVFVLTEKSSEVRKVGAAVSFTDEQVEDVDRAQDYLNNRLMFQLLQRIDSQLLVGDGSAPNLRGTENVASINTQALGADSTPDAIYKAIRQIRATGFSEPSVVFINPSKWEAVRLLKTANGDYVWGHPSVPGPETIWGVPVQLTTAGTSTKAIVGDYARQSEISMRRGMNVQITNSHASNFLSGVQTVRVDARLAVIHYRPTAFTAVTGL